MFWFLLNFLMSPLMVLFVTKCNKLLTAKTAFVGLLAGVLSYMNPQISFFWKSSLTIKDRAFIIFDFIVNGLDVRLETIGPGKFLAAGGITAYILSIVFMAAHVVFQVLLQLEGLLTHGACEVSDFELNNIISGKGTCVLRWVLRLHRIIVFLSQATTGHVYTPLNVLYTYSLSWFKILTIVFLLIISMGLVPSLFLHDYC